MTERETLSTSAWPKEQRERKFCLRKRIPIIVEQNWKGNPVPVEVAGQKIKLQPQKYGWKSEYFYVEVAGQKIKLQPQEYG